MTTIQQQKMCLKSVCYDIDKLIPALVAFREKAQDTIENGTILIDLCALADDGNDGCGDCLDMQDIHDQYLLVSTAISTLIEDTYNI